jgi:multiple antibiotic resistance protein
VTVDWRTFLDTALLFVVLINPASKVALLAALTEQHRPQELVRVAWRASVVGLLLLAVFATAGGWVLRYLFHVELYALDVAAGAVLFLVGLAALKEGVFYAVPPGGSLADISIVPLASPLIAGPATLSAAITQAQRFGTTTVLAAIVVAVLVNLAVMVAGIRLARSLARSHTLAALVRILGLFIASIGASMFLAGIQVWLAQLPKR